MARARSPEKRQALIDAATREIAASGIGASTASIAKAAGLAEGTLFTYFPSKDALLNQLYIDLKTSVFTHLNAQFPHTATLRLPARHIWSDYLAWALEDPARRRVSTLLPLSPAITAQTRDLMATQSE